MDKDLERLKDVAAKLAEHFPDYVILVKTEDSFAWKFTDPTWAVGACSRFMDSIRDQSLIDKMDALEDE